MNLEQFPQSSINKFVTRTPEEEKNVREYYSDKFHNQDLDKEFRNKELEKTEEEVYVINCVNGEMNKFLEKYGRKRLDMEAQNIHLFKKEDYEKYFEFKGVAKSDAIADAEEQNVIYKKDETYSRSKFAHLLGHEFYHFGQYKIISAIDKDSEVFPSTPERIRREKRNEKLAKEIPNANDLYRLFKKKHGESMDVSLFQSGLKIELGKKDKSAAIELLTKKIPNADDMREFLREGRNIDRQEYFENLNEALIEELAIRFQKNVLNRNPYFGEEAELIGEYIDRKKKNGEKVEENEIMSARKRIAYDIDNKEYYEIDVELFPYREQREVLNLLISKLFEGNRDRFKDREEVFELIAKSAFTGNIIGKGSWGKLIEDTFGKRTFEKLAKRDIKLGDVGKLKRFVERLSFAKNIDAETGLDIIS